MGNDDRNSIGETALASLAVLGLVIIITVFVRNRGQAGDWINKEFAVDTFYSLPKVSKGLDETALYQSIVGSSINKSCPQVEMSDSIKGILRLVDTNNSSPYSHDVWVLNQECTTGDPFNGTTLTSGDQLYQYLGITSIIDEKENIMLWATVAEAQGKEFSSIEILAPFNFQFWNSNTDSSGDIVIVSKAGDLKVTFHDVVNWFCAGSPSAIGSGDNMASSEIEWRGHGVHESSGESTNPHYTVVGSSGNSRIKEGRAGNVIGYADSSTSIIIERFKDGKWEKMSLKEWLG